MKDNETPASDSYRSVEVKPANHGFRYFQDEAIVFAGVEIELTEKQVRREKKTEKLFLTVEELATLLEYVNKNKIIMQQFHWAEDGT